MKYGKGLINNAMHILSLHNIHIKYLMIYIICRQYCIHLLQGHAPFRFNSLTCFIKEIVMNAI